MKNIMKKLTIAVMAMFSLGGQTYSATYIPLALNTAKYAAGFAGAIYAYMDAKNTTKQALLASQQYCDDKITKTSDSITSLAPILIAGANALTTGAQGITYTAGIAKQAYESPMAQKMLTVSGNDTLWSKAMAHMATFSQIVTTIAATLNALSTIKNITSHYIPANDEDTPIRHGGNRPSYG